MHNDPLKKRHVRRADRYRRTASGAFVYTGSYCAYRAENPHTFRSCKIRLGLLWAIPAAAVLAEGCLPVQGMLHAWYVILPFLLQVLFAFLEAFPLVRFLSEKNPMRDYVREDAVRLTAVCAPCGVGSAIAAAIAEAFCWIGGNEPDPFAVIDFYCLVTVAAVCGIALQRTLRGIIWEETGNSMPDNSV